MLAFHGAYHGMSQGALALTGKLGPKRGLAGALGSVQFLPFPYSYRCPFGLGGDAGAVACASYVDSVLHDPESGVSHPAGMIVEPVQGEGGVIAAPPAWLAQLRELTRAAQIPLIVDEVQTGFGRTGRYFGFQHADIVPDVLVLSKALGGGLPLSAIVYDGALDAWQPGAHAGTFRGNQLAMAAGLATLRRIKEDRLDQHAHAMGTRLHSHLRRVQHESSCVGDVRGLGLMLGMEIVDIDGAPDRCGRPPACPELAAEIQAGCLRRGLILELGGRHGATVRLLPPLIASGDEIDMIAEIISVTLRDVFRARCPTGSRYRTSGVSLT